jgi:hypothetical protein
MTQQIKILTGEDAQTLQTNVQRYLDTGWELHGMSQGGHIVFIFLVSNIQKRMGCIVNSMTPLLRVPLDI